MHLLMQDSNSEFVCGDTAGFQLWRFYTYTSFLLSGLSWYPSKLLLKITFPSSFSPRRFADAVIFSQQMGCTMGNIHTYLLA